MATPTPAEMVTFLHAQADDARREVVSRETRAKAWEDQAARTVGPDRAALVAKAGVERRIGQHHGEKAAMFDAIVAHLTERTA